MVCTLMHCSVTKSYIGSYIAIFDRKEDLTYVYESLVDQIKHMRPFGAVNIRA